jgi:hypothetical protein
LEFDWKTRNEFQDISKPSKLSLDYYISFGGISMKKSSLFISAILTTFVLAVLAGVVSAAHYFTANAQAASVQPSPTVQETNAVPNNLPPEQLAQIAARFIGRSDLYSVEIAPFNGISAYKVTFSSGDQVYIDPQGNVLSVMAAPSNNPGWGFPSSSPSAPSFGDDDGGD